MNRKMNIALFLLLTSVLIFSACSAQPTVDPGMIYTQAAETVQAQIALTPQNTEAPTQDVNQLATAAVETFQAQMTQTAFATTPTVDPNQVPTLNINATGSPQTTPGQPVVTLTSVVIPTSTTASSIPASSAADKYEMLGQNPADGSIVCTGTDFDMVWTIKNNGTNTWTKLYTIEFFMGVRIGAASLKTIYNFSKEVKPGESIDLIADMTAPTTAGEVYSWWKVKNDQGANFGDVDVTLKIAVCPTSTPTTKP